MLSISDTSEFEERVFVKEKNIYSMIEQIRPKKASKSYRLLFTIKELNLLFVSTVLSQTGCYMTYDICNGSYSVDQSNKVHRFFVFGALGAFCSIGLFTDVILKGRYLYNTTIVYILLEVLFLLTVLVSDETCSSLQYYSLVIQGLLMTSI